MRFVLVWNLDQVSLWRVRGRRIQAVGQASEIQDGAALVRFLSGHQPQLARLRLSVYIDRPNLDHRLERMPSLNKKMQRQLLVQRQLKHYGGDAESKRSWDALSVSTAAIAENQELRLCASYPMAHLHVLLDWARKVGILLDGCFSLPAALAQVAYRAPSERGRIVPFHFFDTVYLMAQDAAGAPLFFMRVGEFEPDAMRVERATQRLALYIEQDFGAAFEVLPTESTEKDSEALLQACVQLSKSQQLNLLPRSARRRQVFQWFRIRCMMVGLLLLGLSAWQLQQFIDQSQDLDQRHADLLSKHALGLEKLQAIRQKQSIEKSLQQVMEFTEDRLSLEADQIAPELISQMLMVVVQAMPLNVEWDALSIQPLSDSEQLRLYLKARPLNQQIDLNAAWEAFQAKLSQAGLRVQTPTIEMIYEGDNTSRFTRNRSLQAFEIELMLDPKNLIQ